MTTKPLQDRSRGTARTILGVVALLLAVWAWAASPAAAQGARGGIDPAFGECERVVDEAALRAQVVDSARGAMRIAAERVNYRTIVEDSWSDSNFDDRFRRIVDSEIATLRQDRAYLERLLDGNVPSRAEEMATRTAEAVFGSEEFAILQQDLQTAIGDRLTPLVADAELDAGTVASRCVITFLGQRYAGIVGDAFSSEARRASVAPSIDASGASVSAAFSLTGVIAAMLTIVFRRVVRRIVAAVVRRLAGAIAARLAAWASVVLGVAFLVYELVAGAEGVFPVIRDELVGAETRVEIQGALIQELSTTAPGELDARADAIADDLLSRWRRFKSTHRSVLDLADATPRFRRFLDDQPPTAFETLSVVVSAVKAEPPGGDEAVLQALDRGLLNRAMRVPDIARHIEAWGPRGVSVEELVTWWELTGDQFALALAADLPALIEPETLRRVELERILGLGDAEAARRLAVMTRPALEEALALDPDQLLALAIRFDGAAFSGLLDALRPAGPARRAALLEQVAARPGLISRLDGAADAVNASADPSAAIEILLSTASSWSPFAIYGHVQTVADGRVAPMVLVHRYGWGLAAIFGFAALFAIGVLRWLGRFIGVLPSRR